MANVSPVTVDNNDQTRSVSWSAMGGTDTGLGAAFGQFPDRTVGVTGTFGGTTVTLQGSFDGGTTWVGVKDFTGTEITFTSAGQALMAENPPLIRPVNTGGSGATLVVTIIGSRA